MRKCNTCSNSEGGQIGYKGFYRYISKVGNSYRIVKDNEDYGTFSTLADALYERDRLIAVDWDLDLAMELPETINGYIHIDLPPFNHEPTYIHNETEHWVVRGKGARQRYYGTYYSKEEAERVAMIYNANITYVPQKFSVYKKINRKEEFFGRYKNIEEAQARVEELKRNNWRK